MSDTLIAAGAVSKALLHFSADEAERGRHFNTLYDQVRRERAHRGAPSGGDVVMLVVPEGQSARVMQATMDLFKSTPALSQTVECCDANNPCEKHAR